MGRVSKALEYFWLVITLVALVLSCYLIFTDGFARNYIYLFFPCIGAAVWMKNRYLRKRFEKDKELEARTRK